MKIVASSFSEDVFLKDFDKNVKLINDFVNKGNMFIIVSGKNISNISKIIDNKYFKCSYFICNDGASIFDQFMNVIYRVDIDKKIAKVIYNALVDSPIIDNVKIDTSTGFINDCLRPANKIVAKYNNYDEAIKLVNTINYRFKELNAYLSHNYINITSKEISKGKSLAYLIDYYNLTNNKIYTIVKDQNDDTLKDYESYIVGKNKLNFKYCDESFSDILKRIEID